MTNVNLLYYYSIISIVPLYFVFYSIYRILYHYNDGREEKGTQQIFSTQMTKRIFILLLIIINIILAAIGWDLHIAAWELYVRSVYYALNSICWLMSFVLLAFEYSRRLEMKWAG